ncbi:MAG: 50S ribosomal protein L11 methyltransferase [Coxiella sp. (in: Bacteria)]|nr:MAG: 50S ribosomal protein L11 methyltransferase [Coxiella sp. (in: g-proteobacteria)]
MPYIEISILSNADDAELIADGLTELDALSVTLEDAKDNAIFQINPNETPLWENVNVKALFTDTISPRTVIADLKQLLGGHDVINYRIEKIADEDWVRKTQQHFKPQCYADQLWICPNWHEEPLDGIVVRIDPGLAFGTGTHPTTSLCLDWLAHKPPNGKIVIDYGCGSGILALAAVMLGAKHVYATDHDEQALIATNNNAQLNDDISSNNLTVCTPNHFPLIQADVIIANILSNPLIELEPVFAKLIKPQGSLILSGILEHEIQAITHAYEPDFIIEQVETKEQWALTLTTRRHIAK